ncbi:MAG TPA: type II toxin-antitoxin system PemK/MazF family toxin [Solirubrobacteraceae bacterium]|nr:type II toxin-antitoxin system PemK/MazF family toxin [Solirubrobacteraceae bacterium]
MKVPSAGQGEVWDCELDPVVGHEQAGRRPCLVISVDAIGRGPSGLVIVVPLSRSNPTRLDVRVDPPEGGLRAVSHALPYHVRTVSRRRLIRRRGWVGDATLSEVIGRIRLLIRVP